MLSYMSEEQAINTILHQCVDEDGFLVSLHVRREFRQEDYSELVAALKTYREIISDEEAINRKIAGVLYYLVVVLSNQVTAFPRSEAEKQLINRALAECSEIVEDIFTPDS
jgi:hypothetical protein